MLSMWLNVDRGSSDVRRRAACKVFGSNERSSLSRRQRTVKFVEGSCELKNVEGTHRCESLSISVHFILRLLAVERNGHHGRRRVGGTCRPAVGIANCREWSTPPLEPGTGARLKAERRRRRTGTLLLKRPFRRYSGKKCRAMSLESCVLTQAWIHCGLFALRRVSSSACWKQTPAY